MEGKVKVNGLQTKFALADVVTDEDKVSVGNLKIFPENKFSVPNLWIANKLANEKLSFKPGLQKDVSMFKRFDNSNIPTNLVPINALDFIGEGLCLLTDDPEFAYYVNRPHGPKPLEKEYRVRVHGLVSQSKVQGLKYGITVDGVSYKPFHVNMESQAGVLSGAEAKRHKAEAGQSKSSNSWLRIVTTDRHPRGVKNVLERMFIKVNRLICTRVDGYSANKSPSVRGKKKRLTKGAEQADGAGTIGELAMPLPGQIVGPISILHNKYQTNPVTQKSVGAGGVSAIGMLQQNLLSYLYIQQTSLARMRDEKMSVGGGVTQMPKGFSNQISSSATLRF